MKSAPAEDPLFKRLQYEVDLEAGKFTIDVKSLLGDLDKIYNHGVDYGLSTGFVNLDPFYRIRKGEMAVVTGLPGSGKALSIDTEVPTLGGWKLMRDIFVGDQVYDENGNLCNVTHVTETMYDRQCYTVVLSDGTRIIADKDHQWLTRDYKARCSELNSRKNNRIIPRDLKPKGSDQTYKKTYPSVKTTDQIAKSLIAGDGRRNHAIKNCAPVNYPTRELLVDPYVLGAWLGDGTSTDGSITCGDAWILKKIQRKGYRVTKRKAKYSYGCLGLKVRLREINVLGNKHIPWQYMLADVEQRMQLIYGLMDTDGYCDKNGMIEYTTMRPALAEQILELLFSVGIIANMSTGIASIGEKKYGTKYRISFKAERHVFLLPRKRNRQKTETRFKHRFVVSCEPCASVPVKCIAVDSPSHLFLVTRRFVPTHNSSFVDCLLMSLAKEHNWKFSLFSPENKPYQIHLRKLVEIHAGEALYKRSQISSTEEVLRMQPYKLAEALKFVSERFYWVNLPEPKLSNLIDVWLSHIEKYKIDGVVLDPWNELETMCPPGVSETTYINQCLMYLREFARINQVALWIVAHPTKMYRNKDGDFPVPTLNDIAGSYAWRAKADIGIVVHRQSSADNVVDILVQKVRFKTSGKPGHARLNYDYDSGRMTI